MPLLARLAMIALGLLLTEMLLRLLLKNSELAIGRRQVDVASVSDPDLGWNNAPGSFVFNNLRASQDPLTVHILPDGSRATMSSEPCAIADIALVGDSFFFGYGVGDRETVGWRLAEEFAPKCVKNFAVPAYSTFQSLLMMRRLIGAQTTPPTTILYGFNVFHDFRNVGMPWWRNLLSLGKPELATQFPACGLDEKGALVENMARPPIPQIPGRRRFFISDLLQELLVRLLPAVSDEEMFAVTTQLVERMQVEASRRGVRFVAVFLSPDTGPHQSYTRYFHERGINYVDCVHPRGLEEAFRVPGDSHPNGAVHEYWRQCIADYLRKDSVN